MTRPLRARFDVDALRRNYRLARERAQGARAWAVIKANAYGHGLRRVAAALWDEADGFALLDTAEALGLRQAGFERPILLLEGCFDAEDLVAASVHDLTVVVHCAEQLEMLASVALPRPVSVYLKLNTGMNRLGFAPPRFGDALAALRQESSVGDITLMTHFADADGGRGIAHQMSRFAGLAGHAGLPTSVANSAAILRHPEVAGAWVRPGIMLYGSSPFADLTAEALGLRPVMTLESQIIGIQDLAPGQRVGYGGTFVAPRTMRLGVVACGYADGYPRHAPSGTPVLVAGKRSALCGRVSMDMLAVDLSNQPVARVGTPVTLWGQGLPADEVAAAAGTISYELFCALAPRVPAVDGVAGA